MKSKDLEFHVQPESGMIPTKIFSSFEEASGAAIAIAISTGSTVVIDVVVWSKTAAKAWAGDHGVEVYKEDPEASIHERLVVKATSLGRIA